MYNSTDTIKPDNAHVSHEIPRYGVQVQIHHGDNDGKAHVVLCAGNLPDGFADFFTEKLKDVNHGDNQAVAGNGHITVTGPSAFSAAKLTVEKLATYAKAAPSRDTPIPSTRAIVDTLTPANSGQTQELEDMIQRALQSIFGEEGNPTAYQVEASRISDALTKKGIGAANLGILYEQRDLQRQIAGLLEENAEPGDRLGDFRKTYAVMGHLARQARQQQAVGSRL